MSEIEDLFFRLAKSTFRQRFHLGAEEYDYCQRHGAEGVAEHCAAFIRQRLAPAQPAKDGKQTPLRGHPVFIAQHATATCCRGCLNKWHHIPMHVALSGDRQLWIHQVIMHWLRKEMQQPAPAPGKSKARGSKPDAQLTLL